jgi:galactonate dehydratase
MKITAVKHFSLKVGHRNIFIVKIETDAGTFGLGESGTSSRERALGGMIDHFARILIGQDPRRIEHIWQMLYRRQYFEGGTVIAAALSAVDIALWDILGKSLGVPVYQLLGGKSREYVTCFIDAGSLNSEACVEQARQRVAEGWHHLRFLPAMPSTESQSDSGVFEPRESIELAVRWLQEVREAVGPGIELAIDYHHRLSVADAADFCRKAESVHLMFLEEPIRSENAEAYAALRGMTSMPFAIGEEFSSKWAFRPFIESGLANYARVDLCNVGGFTEARKVAGWCEAHYIDMMPHNPLGAICMAATAHFCTAINNFALQEHNINSANYPPELFPVIPTFEQDRIILSESPGLGVEFNEEAALDYGFEYWECPMYTRRDGAFTNW